MNKKKEIINQEITKIYKNHGEVKASVVVDSARPKSAPLHSFFEWNDKKAAEEYRLNTARRMIKKAVITIDKKEDRLVHVPTVNRKETREGYYKPVNRIVENIDEFTLAIEEATMKLRSAKAAVDRLHDAAKKKGADESSESIIAKISYALKTMDSVYDVIKTLH